VASPPPNETRPLGPALREFLRGLRFRPAWIDALRGYNGGQFQRDVTAGLVVGVVALPLGIAFAIASGADPRAGLITAALAGMLVAVFGGSRVQVAGPTGAFVVILYAVTKGDVRNMDDLFVATLIAGVLLVLFGLLRLGNLIKFIPFPVTTGFTAGIAVLIFLQQLPHLLGLRLNERGVQVPGETIGRIEVYVQNLGHVSLLAFAVAVATILIIQLTKRYVPRIPGPALALLAVTVAATWILPGRLQTVGDLFTIPSGAPTFAWPDVSYAHLRQMFPAGVTIALLGAIESLLSAVVADGMTELRHDSNQELMGQGITNIILPFFGGFAATGAIARTATNVQNGGRTPVASFVHGAVVLLVLVAAAPLASAIPMALLAGILAVVCWNMSERHKFAQLLRMPASDAGVMVVTFGLTVLVDLTVAVGVGMLLAAVLFIARMSNLSRIHLGDPEADQARKQNSIEGHDVPSGVQVYSIDGPFFFGAAEQFQEIIGRVGTSPKVVVFRMRRAPYLDATALHALATAVKGLHKRGIQVILSAPQSQPLEMMMRAGFIQEVGDQNIQPNIEDALRRARGLMGMDAPPAPV
jgi:sulfate permease, SulP family